MRERTVRRRGLLAALAALAIGAPTSAAAQPTVDGEPAVRVRAVPARSAVRPGDQLPIAVVIEHAEGFHTWPNEPVVPPEFGDGLIPIATAIDVTAVPAGAQVRRLQWPDPVPVRVNYTGTDVDLLSYVGRTVAYVPLALAPETPPGRTFVELAIRYQTCDETTCYFPEDVELRVPFEVIAPAEEGDDAANEPELFAAFDFASFGQAGPGAAARTATTVALRPLRLGAFGREVTFDPRGPAGFALLLLLAALGGLVLNLTPCVLPVLPIKVMGLGRAAGDPGRLLLLGASMSAGVVAFWLAIGGAIAFVSGFDAISGLYQTAWFSPAVGVVVGAMGLSLLGAFRIPLPQVLYRADPNRETVGGSFLFGVMAAVLSTPCTAPFMAGASAWAATQAPATTLATFAAIGAGMASPYLALAARPAWVAKVPRTGAWSEVVKQVLGLILLAVASFFVGTALAARGTGPASPPSRAYWWVVAGFVVAACGWATWRAFALSRSGGRRVAVGAVSAGVAALTLLAARSFATGPPTDWVWYTPAAFDAAAAESRVVVMDFTAEWCLNCKALEAAVLEREEIVALLESPDVVPMRVDLTADNPAGRALLRELEWVGIPLLAVYGPATGYETPQKFDSYTPSMIVEAVERARGTAGAAS